MQALQSRSRVASRCAISRRRAVVVRALKPGDMLPTFSVETDKSTNLIRDFVKSEDIVKGSGAVIFFYPKADTPGCTNQACGFRDKLSIIQEMGYKVYGMSADTPAEQAAWKTKYSIQYPLLCDPSFEVLRALGVEKPEGKKVNRSHMIIERGGRVKAVAYGVAADQSLTEVLKVLNPPKDALEEFCESAPDADECRVYSD